MRTPEDLVFEARKLIGVKFKHQGRTAERGVDCLGLLVLAVRNAGWEMYDETDYLPHPKAEFLRRLLDTNLIHKPITGSFDHGDILLLREGNITSHCGIVDKPLAHSFVYMIHGYGPARKVVKEHLKLGNRNVVAAFTLRP